jgi:hypothetical protein
MTPRQYLLLTLAATLVFAGWHYRSLLDDRGELKDTRKQLNTAIEDGAALDRAVADKIETDAAIDRGVDRVLDKNQETARHVPEYREYLDRPLPAESLRLYRDAAKAARERTGADAAEQGDDQDDRGAAHRGG